MQNAIRSFFNTEDRRHGLVIALAIIIFFAPCFTAEFANWDDPEHVYNNELIKNFSLASIPKIISTPDSANNTYIPLTILIFAIEQAIVGLKPFIFHLNNIVLHIIVSILVYQLGMRWGLSRSGALAAALIFALHPTKVEVIGWVTALKDTLYSCFYLLALHQYTSYIKASAERLKVRHYMLTLTFGILAILSKPMALSLPWILFLVDWWHGRKFTLQLLLEKIPFFAILDGIGLMTYLQNKRDIDSVFPINILMWMWSLGFYIKKFFLPIHLNPVYTVPSPINLSNPAYIKSLAIVLGTFGGCYYFRRNRWVVLGLLYFLGSIFFLIRVDYIADVSIVADRFLYLTSFAACLALGRGWEIVAARRDLPVFQISSRFKNVSLAHLVLIFVLLSFGSYSFYLSRFWKNPMTFWTRAIANEPNFTISYYNRGLMWMQKEEWAKAIEDFNRSTVFAKDNPRHYKMPFSYLMSGLCYLKLGEGEKALENVDLALTMQPEEPDMQYNKGYVLSALGRYDESLPFFDRAILLDKGSAKYYNDRAITYKRLGRFEDALADYSKAIAIDERLPNVFINRGLLYLARGNQQEALADFLKSTKINDKDPIGLKQAGAVYFQQKNIPQALNLFEKALKEDPDDAETNFNLGVIYSIMKDEKRAQESFANAERLGFKMPNSPKKGTEPF